MGKLIQFPCRDHYEEWNYERLYEEDYYSYDNNAFDQHEREIKNERYLRSFIKKCLVFVLARL